MKIVVALVLLQLLGGTSLCWALPVETVQVTIKDAGGKTSDPLLTKMAAGMQIVAQQLFQDKQAEAVDADRAGYEKLLGDISDRVLTGYETEKVALLPGKVTQVVFTVTPWANVIHNPKIDLQFSGVSPWAASYLLKRLPGLEASLAQTLEGASLDAADWAGGVLRNQVRAKVEQQLPEFKAAVDLTTQDNQATLQVVIYPVGDVVRRVRYQMLSKSIPNVLLLEMKYRYAERLNNLRGLPVQFVSHHEAELEEGLLAELRQEKPIQVHHLTPTVKLVPGSDLLADISVESSEYKLWFEGYADVGRDDHNISGRAHLGRYFSPYDEIFAEASLDMKDMDWKFNAGYAYHLGKTTISLMREMSDTSTVLRLEQDITPKWRLRFEHFSNPNVNEYGIRYRIHEFLSGEYVYSTEKSYFRIIGNL